MCIMDRKGRVLIMLIAQIIASVIFVAMFVFIIIDKIERQWVTLTAGACTLVFVFLLAMKDVSAIWETLNFAEIFTGSFWISHTAAEESSGINWATIIFIAGMMVMVEGMARAGVFSWICVKVAKLVDYKGPHLLVAFMIMSGVLSMFIDSITVILFLAAVTMELARLLKFDPVPMVIGEIFCANLGGSATMCGDPPNIIIGTSLGYSFADFLTNTGLIAGISLVLVIIYFYICFRKEMRGKKISHEQINHEIEMVSHIDDKRTFYISSEIFIVAVVLLVTHSITGFSVAFIGVIATVLTLATQPDVSLKILKRVDWNTLLFFIGLFVVVSGLEKTGVLTVIAGAIEYLSGGSIMIMLAIVIWVSGIASAFIDNIPFAATMIPVIKSIALTSGCPLPTLAWALALGTDIGGSATPIGASANVVGISVCAAEGKKISWGYYCKYMLPASVITLVLSTLYIKVRYL